MKPGAVEPDGAPRLVPLSSWGRAQFVDGEELRSENLEHITERAVLTRGLGRSYGDAPLPGRRGDPVATSVLANRLLRFDSDSGVLRAEAGLSLSDLNPQLLRRGWFPPVSPGTKFVTLGGMVAADVHGKNHHGAGTLGSHVRGLRMRLAGGDLVECGPSREPELFEATLGGMGLTGHILEVELQLVTAPSPWIWQRVERAANLGDLLRRLLEAGRQWPYTVAWSDVLARGRHLGRGVVVSGRWAEAAEAPLRPPTPRRRIRVPLDPPSACANALVGRLFNVAYHALNRESEGIVDSDPFFYPLDALVDWNRLYGRRGFTQYQCVFPHDDVERDVAQLFELIHLHGGTPMLCVIKDFGDEGLGMLSFPKPGVTVSVDLPVRQPGTQRLVDRLGEHVIDAGGRVYLAKDAFTRAEHFAAMEPRLPRWKALRQKLDPAGRLRSALSRRLFGDDH